MQTRLTKSNSCAADEDGDQMLHLLPVRNLIIISYATRRRRREI